MKTKGWDYVIVSDPSHEHVVAELLYDGRLLVLLDRELGKERVSVAFPPMAGQAEARVALEDLVDALRRAARDLSR